MRPALFFLLAAVLLLQPSLLGAQAVQGRLVDQGTERGISSAFVILQDSAGRPLARVLTGTDGAF